MNRPLFTWLRLEHYTDEGGTIVQSFHHELLINRDLAQSIVDTQGAKRWRILETLAFHSVPDPTGMRRLVYATIKELAALCGGADAGWSTDAMRKVIRGMEDEGAIVRFAGQNYGRGRGSAKSGWTLSDGLFAVRGTATAETMPQTAVQKETTPQNTDPIPNESPKRATVPRTGHTPDLRAGNGGGPQSAAKRGSQHADEDESHEILMSAPITIDASLDPAVLLAVVVAQIRALGWTGNLDAIRRDPLRAAAWLVYTQRSTEIRKPGALIRQALADGSWPERLTGTLTLVDGTLTLLEPPAPTIVREHSTADLRLLIEQDPDGPAILRLINETLKAAGPIPDDPAARSAAWRRTAQTLLEQRGLL